MSTPAIANIPKRDPASGEKCKNGSDGGKKISRLKAGLTMGDRLCDFNVKELLGKGGFACVYAAQSKHTGEKVALKVIDKKQMMAVGLVSKIKSEIEVHYQLKHPSILTLHNCFEDNNYVYMVVELCDTELYSYLRNMGRKLRESEAREFLKQIVEGISYLHSFGIIHRDLKLSNLLVTGDKKIKIADFGLAAKLKNVDETRKTMCGTPNFIAPEIVQHQPHGLQADVWSLGCILYTMLVGNPPFERKNVKDTLARVQKGEYSIPSSVSPAAQDLIQHLLQADPTKRPSLQTILRHRFLNPTITPRRNSNSNSWKSPLQPLRVDHSLGKVNNTLNFKEASRTPENSVRKNVRRIDGENIPNFRNSPVIDKTRKVPFERTRSVDSPVPVAKLCHVDKLNTKRLRPIRQQARNVIVNIIENGDVKLEFLKGESICEIFSVSSEGAMISISKPLSRHPDDIYSFRVDELPEKHVKKYQYASQFVDLVKTKTPKLTIYTDRAKCMLMENNPPDFECWFYNGAKVQYSSAKETVRFIEQSGVSRMFNCRLKDAEGQPSFERSEDKRLIRHAYDNLLKLTELNLLLGKVGDECFPVILSRRPNEYCDSDKKVSDEAPVGHIPVTANDILTSKQEQGAGKRPGSVIAPPSVVSYEGSVSQFSSSGSQKQSRRNSSCSPPVGGGPNYSSRCSANQQSEQKTCTIPRVGTAVQHPNGDLCVKFIDGVFLKMPADATSVYFVEGNGRETWYELDKNMPSDVKQKLKYFSSFVEKLYTHK
eukprot:Nk52_evm2s1810 gene=Nk52_evmTU2s1810